MAFLDWFLPYFVLLCPLFLPSPLVSAFLDSPHSQIPLINSRHHKLSVFSWPPQQHLRFYSPSGGSAVKTGMLSANFPLVALLVAGVIRDRSAKPLRGCRGEFCRAWLLGFLVEGISSGWAGINRRRRAGVRAHLLEQAVEGSTPSPASWRSLFFFSRKAQRCQAGISWLYPSTVWSGWCCVHPDQGFKKMFLDLLLPTKSSQADVCSVCTPSWPTWF